MLLDAPYQGNVWWASFAAFAALMLARILLGLRRRRRAGQKVEIRAVLIVSLFFLAFIIVAVSQVLSHL
jgi:hypothetical protein